MRNWLLLAIAALAAYWWMQHEPAMAVVAAPPDVHLPTVPISDAPLQRNVDGPVFKVNGFEVRALATYSATARVLSTERYRYGDEAGLSPMDLALGWGRMADPKVIDRLTITQGGRYYTWRYQRAPPIPRQEIVESSANTHIIPASAAVAQTIARAGRGDIISLKGYLVQVSKPDGWHWRSSLTRSDAGSHACELMFVQSAVVE